MASDDTARQRGSVKQQLLREMVQENLLVKKGRPVPRRRSSATPRRFAFGLVVALLAVSVYFVPRGTEIDEGLPPPEVVPAALTPATLPMADLPELPPERVAMVAPSPIDSAVFPVGVRRIVIDPGHGGRDVGTVTSDGLREKDMALDIGLRLASMLEGLGEVEVMMTRTTDRYVSLKDRSQVANDAGADLFLSIHVNWLEPRSARGVETYYLGTTQDPFLVELTSRENRESGYSLADVRELLDGIYLGIRQDQSRRFAAAVQGSLFDSLQHRNPELDDRGVKQAPFLVLVATDMPAILAEVSCLSNRKEAELLATAAYRQQIAEALLQGIRSFSSSLSQAELRGG